MNSYYTTTSLAHTPFPSRVLEQVSRSRAPLRPVLRCVDPTDRMFRDSFARSAKDGGWDHGNAGVGREGKAGGVGKVSRVRDATWVGYNSSGSGGKRWVREWCSVVELYKS